METAQKITEPDRREAVLCLLIARKAYQAFKAFYRFLSQDKIDFSIHYVNLAIEHDSFDILAVLKKSYPEDFERN